MLPVRWGLTEQTNFFSYPACKMSEWGKYQNIHTPRGFGYVMCGEKPSCCLLLEREINSWNLLLMALRCFSLKYISAVGTLTRRDKAPHFTLLHPKESSLWLQFIYFLWLALCSRLQRKSSSPNKVFLRFHSNIENCKTEKYNICSLKVIIPEPFDYEISILSRNKLEWTANKSTF